MRASLPVVNYLLALIGSGVTYAMMLEDASESRHWIHVLTLTPLLPYVIGAGLAYRHRRRPRRGLLIAGFLAFTIAVGWPMFWFFYLPQDVRPATKVLIKIILPVLQGVIGIVLGVALELAAGPRRDDGSIARY